MAKKKAATKLIGVPWSLSQIWNETLDTPDNRILAPRDYIYASELGYSFADRYLKMYGVKFTNPPNTRSRRKFQAGNIWEWVLGIVLISSGMLKKKQLRVEAKLPRLLRVSGRLDYVVGSPENWNNAKEQVKKIQDALELLKLDVPPFFFKAIDKFIEKYSGQNIRDVIFEAKSLSHWMMNKVLKTGIPLYHHAMQIFHYVYGNDEGIQEGKLFYLSKDDCLTEEFVVNNDERLFDIYHQDIKMMTKYYNAGFDKKNPMALMPPKEPLILFEEGVYTFSKNTLGVEYSPYLTMLYGYETPEAYRMSWQYKINSWNRVFKRCVRGDKMTDKNVDVIKDAKALFPNWDKLVAKAKAAGAFIKEEEDEEN